MANKYDDDDDATDGTDRRMYRTYVCPEDFPASF